MLAYAGKCLGKLTGKVLQNAGCIVLLFPACLPSSAPSELHFVHSREAWPGFLLYERGLSGRESQKEEESCIC